ncbi:hypothetical protein KO489_00075 [Reinekea forsetii]|nr:hypothetical protein [Reinekea forsetii]
MTQSLLRTINTIFLGGILCVSAGATEFGLDGSFSSSPLVNAWGAGSHVQIISDQGLGVDFGARYFSDISYETESFGELNQDNFLQYEVAGLKQWGDKGFRVQMLAGALFSGVDVATPGGAVIDQFEMGYRLDAGMSVPVFTHFRAFAEGGYQGWPSSEMPGSLRWRYGLRLNFGGNNIVPLEAVEQQQVFEAEQKEAQELTNPSTTIDTRVPQYVPGNMSESLPPIIEFAELCKCYPAGPYTLQLGEFKHIEQAVRAMEYRGLRQFFNSRAYQKNPLPVFLAQIDEYGSVALFLGEINELPELRYWRHELKKNGISARLRKVIGDGGERVENPTIALDPALLEPEVTYTAEEIARMNSLPATGEGIENINVEQLNSAEPVVVDVQALNSLPNTSIEMSAPIIEQQSSMETKPETIEGYVQVGPLTKSALTALLNETFFKRIMASDETMELPTMKSMVWDETRQEAWLNFSGFHHQAQLDNWRAMFTSENFSAKSLTVLTRLNGDIYQFVLGAPINKFSVEVDRAESNLQILSRLRSPEVLWFEAFQRINQNPVTLSLNYSMADARYRIVVANLKNKAQQTEVWTHLTAVGLMPSLAEQ